MNNDNDFADIRREVLNKSTASEYQIASRIVKTMDIKPKQGLNDPLVNVRLNKQSKWISNLTIHYKYEQRLATYQIESKQSEFNKTDSASASYQLVKGLFN